MRSACLAGDDAQPFDESQRQALRMLHDAVAAGTEHAGQIGAAIAIHGEAIRQDLLQPRFMDGLARILDTVAAGIAIAIVAA